MITECIVLLTYQKDHTTSGARIDPVDQKPPPEGLLSKSSEVYVSVQLLERMYNEGTGGDYTGGTETVHCIGAKYNDQA